MRAAKIPYLEKSVNDAEFPAGLVVASAFKNSAQPLKYGVVQSADSLR